MLERLRKRVNVKSYSYGGYSDSDHPFAGIATKLERADENIIHLQRDRMAESNANLHENRAPKKSGSNQGPLTVPECRQRQTRLPVPLNVNQLLSNVTLTR